MPHCEQPTYDRYDALLARHAKLIERLCMRRALGDEQLCADLVQECAVGLWRALDRLDDELPLWQEQAWVVWRCRSVLSHLPQRREALWLQLDDELADTQPAPDHRAAAELLEEMGQGLSPQERRALALMAEGYGVDDTALALGIKPESAAQLRYRVRRKLRPLYGPANRHRPSPTPPTGSPDDETKQTP